MKKFILHITVVLVAFMSQSCTKSLQENPRTFISPDAFFSSPESYEQAVKGIYVSLPGTVSGNAMMMRETFSDIIGTPSASYEQALPTYQNNHQPFFYNVREQWSTYYTIVKNANFILQKVDESVILSDEQRNKFSAEARLLRAFAYFCLVQLYGDIPMPVKPVEDYGDLQIARSPQEEVYSLITGDLSFAETYLPEMPTEQGRVNKWVATALAAKVYLTMAGYPLNKTEHFEDARDKALEVINSGKYSLVEDYSELFHKTNYTSETIWEQQYDADNGGNPLHTLTVPATGFVPILLPATWFINSFAPGDERKLWGIQQNYIAPGGTTLPAFFNKFANQEYIENESTPTAANRLNFSFPILRLAEMHLIAAETENEINGPAAAYQYINAIRRRAGILAPDLLGLSKDEFRDAVLMERKWELHLEGSTWFDLKRTKTLNRIQTIRGTDLVHPIGEYNYTWYIPDNEITNNNISQNPIYQ